MSRFTPQLPPAIGESVHAAAVPCEGGYMLDGDWIAQHPVHAAWLDANDVLRDEHATAEQKALAEAVMREYANVEAAKRQWQPVAAADNAMRLAEVWRKLKESIKNIQLNTIAIGHIHSRDVWAEEVKHEQSLWDARVMANRIIAARESQGYQDDQRGWRKRGLS